MKTLSEDTQTLLLQDEKTNAITEKLIIFCAPSGSGKTTLVRHLLSIYGEKMAFSVSATTREPRAGEIDGVHYLFLSKNDFENRISDGQFVEYEEVYQGNYYGTLRIEIEKLWKAGKIVLFDVDVKGGLSLKKIYGEKALAVFVRIPDLETLRMRLEARQTETSKNIEKRMSKAAFELTFEPQFDVTLINDRLESACAELEKIVADFLKG
jgi:guanylate kinase